MPESSSSFPDDLQKFIDSTPWTFAKTMPKWLHEYIVRDRVDANHFVKLVQHIRRFGYLGKYYDQSIVYYDAHGMSYWTVGDSLEETIIINRCRKEDTYESRLARGSLPD